MPRTDTAHRLIDASPDRVFAALIDRDALSAWLPPAGMTARFEHFDPRPGGSYRLVLSYTDPPGSGGKAGDGTDIVEARYLDIVPGEKVVQAVDFDSSDAAFAGTMTMTWQITTTDVGSRVDIVADNVPDGISPDDHAAGMASSLENLARHLERPAD